MIDNIKELIENGKYQDLKKFLSDLEEADVAEILEGIKDKDTVKVFRLLPKDRAADVFALLDIDNQQVIIDSLTDKEAAHIIDEMAADDAADLIDELPSNVVKRILSNTTPETRKDINHLLKFPDDSAGSIMTVEFLDIKSNITIKEAIEKIRQKGKDKETLDFCYVLDAQRKLLGTLSLKEIILSPSDTIVKDIMEDEPVFVNTLTDQEEVANMFQK